MFLTIKITSYIAYFVILVCFLGGVMSAISYVKGTRGEGKRYPLSELVITGIFGAGGVLLVYCLSREIRQDDKLSHHKVLWLNLLFLMIHIIILVLLVYFQVVDSSSDAPSTAFRFLYSRY